MNNFMMLLQSLQSNPMQFLNQRGISIPQNISNDPNAITQYLLNTGRITQQQYNQANSTARQMMNQIPNSRGV